jgi:hypothetical protein
VTRRFPPPWTVEETDVCFIVRDGNRQALAYVYFEDEPGRRSAAHLMTCDEARSKRSAPQATTIGWTLRTPPQTAKTRPMARRISSVFIGCDPLLDRLRGGVHCFRLSNLHETLGVLCVKRCDGNHTRFSTHRFPPPCLVVGA